MKKITSTNPKDILGATKPTLHLIPPSMLIWTAKAMEYGAAKYGPYNWRHKKVRLTVYISAAMRHLAELLDGDDFADDSKVRHPAHVCGCMAVLLDAIESGNLIDDRPPKGPAGRLMKALTVKKGQRRKA